MKSLINAILGIFILTGCSRSQPYVDDVRLDRGLVLILPGIEGRSLYNREICNGLIEGGVDWAIERCDWTVLGRWTALYNLRAEKRNRRKAAEIAGRIVSYQQKYPGRCVVLVGQSGGAAMAAWIAEAMPDQCEVDGIIMLAAALSPEYRLDAALEKSRRGIINSYSILDCWYLGIGTTLFGTSDGRHGSAAGRTGFQVPDNKGKGGDYSKLFQIQWRKEMIKKWNLGGHLTSGARYFVAKYIAPLVKSDSWDEQVIEKTVNQ